MMSFDKKSIEGRQFDSFVESPTRQNKTAREVFIGGVDANASEETITLVDTASTTIIYIGSALPGSLSSQAVWRIQRVDLTTSEIKILFADSDQNFDNIWDNRASLSYG
jgi:hypothetical protein